MSDAATADPDAERSLLDAAPEESLAELRNRAERVKAAARSAEDEAAREERIRRSRSLRRSVAADGAHELHARGTASDIAAFWSRLQPFLDAEFKRARTEDRRESVDAYVRRIMVNENNSLWRRGWRRRETATDAVPETVPVHDRYDEGTGAAVWAVVQTLPRKARAVVVLRYYEQLTEAETAEVLGISVGTVKSQCSRALASLRERIGEEAR